MNLTAASEALASINGHTDVALDFVLNKRLEGRDLELELLGRANLVDAAVARLRAAVLDKSGRPDIHVLGDRPGAAA